MFNSKNWAIAHISPDLISFADKNTFTKAKLPSTIFSNFELSQEADLTKITDKLFEGIKIKNNRLIVVISGKLSFNKTFTKSDQILNLAQQYLDNIPLENILFSLVSDSKNYQLSVVNQYLVEKIKTIFKKYNFVIKSIVPESLLETKNINDQQKLRFTQKNKLKSVLSTFIVNNFSDTLPKIIFPNDSDSSKSKKNKLVFLKSIKFFKKINKIWLLVSLALIIIIGSLIFIFPKFKKTSVPEIIVEPTVIPTPTEVIVDPSTVNLQITYTRYSLAKTLNQLKNDLNKLNYTKLNLTRDLKMKYIDQTYLIFSATNSASFKDPIIKTITNIFKEVIVQESVDVNVNTVSLKLGRNK